jgi:hypothetical protein
MPTKVFISWSGALSRKLGEALRDWLPKTLQSVKPYFSPNDIEKGTRWDSEVAGELGASDIGIICITPENTERPWLLFEAGALSKAVDKARVCPVLFGGLKPTDLSGPLASFQLTQFEKEDFRKLVVTINANAGEAQLEEKVLDGVFEKWWPDLQEQIAGVLRAHKQNPAPIRRSQQDLLEEILGLVRAERRPKTTYRAFAADRRLWRIGVELLHTWHNLCDDNAILNVNRVEDALEAYVELCQATGNRQLLCELTRDFASERPEHRETLGKLRPLIEATQDEEYFSPIMNGMCAGAVAAGMQPTGDGKIIGE